LLSAEKEDVSNNDIAAKRPWRGVRNSCDTLLMNDKRASKAT
jgi:hypothetical protein